MLLNPFSSSTYETIWMKHYGNSEKPNSFNFIDGVKFIKSSKPSQFVNIGRNLTSGMFYKINNEAVDYKGKSFVVYDVPDYLDLDNPLGDSDIKILKLKQYRGIQLDITKCKSIDDVVSKSFTSSKSRYNFRRTLRQLHEKHDITHKMFFGHIEKEEYDQLTADFQRILEIRFEALNIHNSVLPEWEFYKEVLFPLINEKQVALLVIYDAGKPIALSYNFAYGENLVLALRTFDINYSKLGLGNIELYYLIEWSIENKVNILDFSKGIGPYKERWCDTEYYFEHHIIYDSKSIKATVVAKGLANFYIFKQYLRKKNVNTLVTKWQYKLKHLLSFSKS